MSVGAQKQVQASAEHDFATAAIIAWNGWCRCTCGIWWVAEHEATWASYRMRRSSKWSSLRGLEPCASFWVSCSRNGTSPSFTTGDQVKLIVHKSHNIDPVTCHNVHNSLLCFEALHAMYTLSRTVAGHLSRKTGAVHFAIAENGMPLLLQKLKRMRSTRQNVGDFYC